MVELARQSPLTEEIAEKEMISVRGIRMVFEEGLAIVGLRTQTADAGDIADGLQQAFGAAPPAAPGVRERAGVAIAWSAPSAWIIVHNDAKGVDLEKRVETAVGEAFALVTDLSDAQCAIRLSGAGAAATLSKLVSIDLDPDVFSPGSCVRTLFAEETTVMLMCLEPGDYRLLVDVIHARFTWARVQEAALGSPW